MSVRYEPALAQHLSAPQHRPTGRPRWAFAIYAADGTLLDVIPHDNVIGWPVWVTELPRLPNVNVGAGEFEAWLGLRAVKTVPEDDASPR